MSNTKTTLAFDRHTSSDSSGYVHTTISINQSHVETLVDLLEGTVDNKAGYGDAEAAVAIGRELEGLIAEGYETRLTAGYSGAYVRLTYLHYKWEDGVQTYCEPSLKVGDRLDVMEKGMKLLKRLGVAIERRRGRTARDVGGYTYRSPDDVMEALRAMRSAVETDIVGRSHFRVAQRKLPKAA